MVGSPLTNLIHRVCSRHRCLWIHSAAVAQLVDRSASRVVAYPIHEALVGTAGDVVVIVAREVRGASILTVAANNGTPQTPQRTKAHCLGQALKQNGISFTLDVVGAIPAFGNLVHAGAATGRIIDGVVAYGGGAYGVATGLTDEAPYGAASTGLGLGLTLAGTALGEGLRLFLSQATCSLD